MMRVLSLGAGVQSTTLALMAAHGEVDRPDVAIFADTQWEPRAVYDHLTWLRSANVLPFPVHIVSQGDIRQGIRDRRNTTGGRFASIPWHGLKPDGSHALGRRQCSSEYKLTPIMYEIRRLLDKPGRAYIRPRSVEVLIGISRDEAQRMRTARQAYMVNRYPLIELGMTRYDCLRWLKKHDYPHPPKSACLGCPFTNNDRWREMKANRPGEWAEAVEYDRILRTGNLGRMKMQEFMHPDRVPLDQVDLSIDTSQPDLFGNECEGLCGV
jgi:hypothetical protein